MNLINAEDLKIIKEVISDRKKNYIWLREYFYNVCIDKRFDYKVFNNPKMTALFKIFIDIFNNYPSETEELSKKYGDFKVCGEFIEMGNIELHKEKMNDKNILLITETVISDETEVFNNINKLKQYNIAAVEVWSVGVNYEYMAKNSKLYPEEIECFKTFRSGAKELTRIYAHETLDLINYTNIGYSNQGNIYYCKGDISTLIDNNSYFYSEEKTEELDRINSCPIFCSRINDNDNNKLKKGLTFYDSEDNFLSKNNIKFCIRFHQKGDNITIIPTVLLPNIKKEEIINFCKLIINHYQINIPDNIKDNELHLYKYMIDSISVLLLKDYLDKMNIDFNKLITFDIYNNNCELNTIKGMYKNNTIKDKNPEIGKYIYIWLTHSNKNKKYNDFNNFVKYVSEECGVTANDVIVELLNLYDEQKIDIINKIDANISTQIKSDVNLYKLWYEVNPKISSIFATFTGFTLENRYSKLYQFAEYFDEIYETKDFINFLRFLDIDGYLFDILHKNRLALDLERKEVTKVKKYINTLYES